MNKIYPANLNKKNENTSAECEQKIKKVALATFSKKLFLELINH